MLSKNFLYIHGIGHFHPDNIIDNQFLEDLDIDTNDGWILERTGIKQRRTVLPLDYIRETYNKNPLAINQLSHPSDAETGANAARMALAQAKLKAKDIGMVIAGSCAHQYTLPATACIIASELGITSLAFDVNSACSSFLAQVHLLAQMNADSLPDYILLVLPDNMTRAVNYRDRSVAVLLGDASAAIILSKKIPSRFRIKSTMMYSDPAGWNKITTLSGGHFAQEGSSVQKFAIKNCVEVIKAIRQQDNLDHYYFVGHQANLLMLNTVCKMANVDTSRHLYNVDHYGNSGAASAPTVLSQHWSRFIAGDKIIVALVGSGLSWGGMTIEAIDETEFV